MSAAGSSGTTGTRVIAWTLSAVAALGLGAAWLSLVRAVGNTDTARIELWALGIALACVCAWPYIFLRRLERRVAAVAQRTGDASHVRELDTLARALADFDAHVQKTLAQCRAASVEAEAVEREKVAFLESVAHELRTPLNAIMGFADVLIQGIDGVLSRAQLEDVRMIKASGEHLLSLFADVMDLTLIASGDMQLRREPVKLAPLVDEVAKLLVGLRGNKTLTVRTSIPRTLPDLNVDPVRLRQVLMNLGSNAVNFTESGSVTISARELVDAVEIAVRDTGVGIPPESIRALFQEYAQVGGRRAKGQGSGLGLAITKRLTELHGGTIRVESRVGVGTAFYVTFPTVPAQAATEVV